MPPLMPPPRQALAEAARQACRACHTFSAGLVRAHVRDAGAVWLCPDPSSCRLRAQDAGIWCRT
jgi:hypothetical protein